VFFNFFSEFELEKLRKMCYEICIQRQNLKFGWGGGLKENHEGVRTEIFVIVLLVKSIIILF
jgi:hypothetical protein